MYHKKDKKGAHDSRGVCGRFCINSPAKNARPLIEILDKLSVDISSRFSNTKELEKRFGFLCKSEAYVNDENILLRNCFPK